MCWRHTSSSRSPPATMAAPWSHLAGCQALPAVRAAGTALIGVILTGAGVLISREVLARRVERLHGAATAARDLSAVGASGYRETYGRRPCQHRKPASRPVRAGGCRS